MSLSSCAGRVQVYQRRVRFASFLLPFLGINFFGLPLLAQDAQVLVTIPPQAFLVKTLCGEQAKVVSLVRKGGDPHSFEFRPSEVKAISQAQVFFLCGLEQEDKWKDKILALNSNIRIFNSARNIPLRLYSPYEGKGTDPHFWLSPGLFKLQATNMLHDLSSLPFMGRERFGQRFSMLARRLDELDSAIRAQLAPFRGRRLFVYHPAFGYFCDTYGLVQISFELEGKEPSPRSMKEFMDMAKKERATFILSTQPSAVTKEIGRALNVPVLLFDPLEEAYVENLKRLADLIVGGFGKR